MEMLYAVFAGALIVLVTLCLVGIAVLYRDRTRLKGQVDRSQTFNSVMIEKSVESMDEVTTLKSELDEMGQHCADYTRRCEELKPIIDEVVRLSCKSDPLTDQETDKVSDLAAAAWKLVRGNYSAKIDHHADGVVVGKVQDA